MRTRARFGPQEGRHCAATAAPSAILIELGHGGS